MAIKYNNKNYITDDDLKVKVLGFWPRVEIKNEKLKTIFGRNFLGGDNLISYAQSLVSHGMDFEKLEEEILKDIEDSNTSFEEILFNKTATGIGRGHSLGGLSGVVLGIHGTKMVDSGLTGLCASRSLVTSSRRRETNAGEIAIPESLEDKPELLKEYMQISEEVFNLSNEFKDKFGKLGGIETFNKVIPYNNPADLFIVLPLDSLATIASEVRADKLNHNGKFVPRELYALSEKFMEITKETGQNIMLNQRIEVPRDTYFHYTVFKDSSFPNYALEKGEELWRAINPIVIETQKDFTKGFIKNLENLKIMNEKIMKIKGPGEIHAKSLEYMYSLREFANEYNEALKVKIADTLSWRVLSEQKRHSTLRQNVESIYSAVNRSYNKIKRLMPIIESANSKNNFKNAHLIENISGELEKYIIIDDRLKKKPEIIIRYIYYTAKQLMFYGKMIEAGLEPRDALYIAPKNIRVRTLENYDLVNLIDLELPLRLCETCEPERKANSWKKREVISKAVPEIDFLLTPKCSVGFCTEGKHCGQITKMREYDSELHKKTKEYMLKQSRRDI